MKRHRIKLVYWKDVPNLGDLLSPFIIEKLFGKGVVYKRRWWGWKAYLKELTRIIIHRQWIDFSSLTHPYEPVLLGVGSILKYANYNAVIWGSGFMNDNETSNAKHGNIKAVRGWLTAKKLGEEVKCVGDPALLLPVILPQTEDNKVFEVGYIPHWSEFDDFATWYASHTSSDIQDKSLLINFRTSEIEETIKLIWKCKVILSSSLHGLILAHAYGIPALWIRNSDCGTDGFKYYDYFSSVEIPLYKGFTDYVELLSDFSKIHFFFEHNSELSLPKADVIRKIQKDLIDSFPF